VIQIGSGRETVSDEPLEFLVACHGRILGRLEILARAADAIERETPAAMTALRNTIRFFDISGRLHTEDEEVSVFPRLRSRLTSEQLEFVSCLESQHRETEKLYEELKTLAQKIERGVTPAAATRLRELASLLNELYRAHIESENQTLMTIGREKLAEDELTAILAEMRARRR
jgi:hemerythrin-like domain-containing protein